MDLSLAVKNGDHARLEELLKNGANVNFADDNEVSLLHQAANYGRDKIVKLLLRSGADVSRVTRDKGNTALHVAVLKSNARVVAALLENSSRDKLPRFLDAKTKKSGSTALHVAAKTRCYDIAKMLLIHGATFDARDKEGKQPVDFVGGEVLEALLKVTEINFALIECGDLELDLEASARLAEQPLDEYLCMSNCRNDEGRTLLQVAMKEYHVHGVKILVGMRNERSSGFPRSNMEALNELADCFEAYFVKLNELLGKLLKARFNSSIATREGNNMLIEARKLVKTFRDYEAKISKPIRILNVLSVEETLEFLERDMDYRGLLQFNPGVAAFIQVILLGISFPIGTINRELFAAKLLEASRSNDLAEAERCLANKVDVNARDEDSGRTALHQAAFYGYANLAGMLLEWNASLTSVDVTGNMPLQIAASNGHVKIVEMLLARNTQMIDVGGTSSEFTALHLAAGAGCLDVVKCLLKRGAAYRAESRSGKTPEEMARDAEGIRFFHLLDRLFAMARDGNNEIIRELKKLKMDELMAVTNARDQLGYNLAQNAVVWKYKAVAETIARMVIRTRASARRSC